MGILEKNKMRPLTKEEALVWLTQNPEMKEQLKGRWFYLAEKDGIALDGLFTVNAKGELVKPTGNETLEQTVRVWSGKNPLCLLVYSDYGAADGGRRFVLDAYGDPRVVAPVVVGVEIGHEVAAQKTAFGGKSAVEYALESGPKEVREVLARHIEEEAGGSTAVSIALRSDNAELRVLVSEALRNRRN
jgi:hypothetical protein